MDTTIRINDAVVVKMTSDQFIKIGHMLHTQKKSVKEVKDAFPMVRLRDIKKMATL